MDAPLAGYLYFDPNLFGGHYFIVGPDDPIDSSKVVAFLCTSKQHKRPDSHGCHSSADLPSFHIEKGTVQSLTMPTWVQLDDCHYYNKSRFEAGGWSYAMEKLAFSLTIELLECAAQSEVLSKVDASACLDEACLLKKNQ